MIIGRMRGGLGNQMFFYAFCRMLQQKYGQKVEIDISGIREIFSLDKCNINNDEVKFIEDKNYLKKKYPIRVFITRSLVSIIFYVAKIISERSKSFVEAHIQGVLNILGYYIAIDGYFPLRFDALSKNIILEGYFQSELYFRDVDCVIRKELMVAEPVKEKNMALWQEIGNANSVCVHIRRGDYFSNNQNKVHAVCTTKYYQNALKKMHSLNPDATFYIFSDDIDWVRSNIKFSTSVRYVENGNVAHEELRLMYTCKHFIISNSSFSWWAQYLSENQNKIVIAPDRWFSNDKKADVYMENWIIVPA